MKWWRLGGRLIATRFLPAIGSVLLTLLLIVSTAAAVAYIYVNQRAAAAGISDWSIRVAELSQQRVIIDQLSLTLTQPAQAGTTSTQPPTLGALLTTKLPTWLPQHITIRSLHINGPAVSAIGAITARLQWTQEQQQVTLKANLNAPEKAAIVIKRQGNSVDLSLKHDFIDSSLSYQVDTGALSAGGQLSLPAIAVDTGSLSATRPNVTLTGTLNPDTVPDSLPALLSALSAQVSLSVTEPATISVNTIATSELTANATLTIEDGIVHAYTLTSQGQLTAWPIVPEPLPAPMQQQTIERVNWQLYSRDELSVALLDHQQLFAKAHWPVTAAVQIESNADSQLQLDADLKVFPETLIIDHNGTLSAQLATEFGIFKINSPALNATINIKQPLATQADVKLNIDTDSVNLTPFRDFPVKTSLHAHYANQQLNADGAITVANDLTLRHNTQVDTQQQLRSQWQADFSWPDAANAQRRWQRLIHHYAPLLELSKGKAAASATLEVDLTTQQWAAKQGELAITDVDLIYDTVALAATDLSSPFTLNPKHLQLSAATLNLGSIQQGFAIGPIQASFTADVPLQQPTQAVMVLSQHQINAFGGSVSLPEQAYRMDQQLFIPVVFEQINLGELMRQYPSDRIDIDGKVSGTLPLVWHSNQLTVDKGYLSAVAPGGHLTVDSSALRSAVGSNPSLRTLASVLENFYYEELSSEIDYDEKGNVILGLRLKGYNPEVENGREVNLNIRLEEDLAALIKGLQLSNSVSDTIRKRIQQKVN
ncbi:hypothetical protein C5610_06005 [Idiomarina sp. OT37-5b]|uniref:intermembrane phospholipid transport protein YdbH family protein n=1 Tax=Idiomarina sp. OT37-5b TaxID=2100422 RepID=UPI000CF96DE9|nr:YdbH domain-containing protein [Idiomarina sp. OT37-5b]AVJ55905.1 hypothetical protein C5610_06005 [Idiomarina sp. OT37-5b]